MKKMKMAVMATAVIAMAVLAVENATAQNNQFAQPPITLNGTNGIMASPAAFANPPQTFFQSVYYFFAEANTNYTFTGNTLEVAAGADYMSSVNWANYFSVQYNLGGNTNLPSYLQNFSMEGKIRNAGIAGTVVSVEGGINYTVLSYYSVKLSAGFDVGYDLNRNSPLLEPKFTLRDKLTPNTFVGLVISLPVWTKGKPINSIPDIGIETGFTY